MHAPRYRLLLTAVLLVVGLTTLPASTSEGSVQAGSAEQESRSTSRDQLVISGPSPGAALDKPNVKIEGTSIVYDRQTVVQPTRIAIVFSSGKLMKEGVCAKSRHTLFECVKRSVSQALDRMASENAQGTHNYQVAIFSRRYGSDVNLTNGFTTPESAKNAVAPLIFTRNFGDDLIHSTLHHALNEVRFGNPDGRNQIWHFSHPSYNETEFESGGPEATFLHDVRSTDVVLDTIVVGRRGTFNDSKCARKSIASEMTANGGRCRIYDEPRPYIPSREDGGPTIVRPTSTVVNLKVTLTVSADSGEWSRTYDTRTTGRFSFDVTVPDEGSYTYLLDNGIRLASGSFSVDLRIKLVGLGDSFSSGAGVYPYFEEGVCLRSDRAYARLLRYPDAPQ
jgi:hypothetical protein